MKRIIIMGSPRSSGRSAHLAEMLFEACIDECPEDELFLVPVSELDIAPCVGCGACRMLTPEGGSPEGADNDGSSSADGRGASVEDGAAEDDRPDYPYCPRFDDDMQDVYPLLPVADELIVVSPVYFSGAPSSLKALLDRLQPHFWADSRKAPKRPATLHVVGEGGDPHGFEPLISEVKSSLACAGFRLERVLDWVGKIAEDGEIENEATEVPLVEKPSLVSVADAPADVRAEPKERPRLSLGGRESGGASAKGGARGSHGEGSGGAPPSKVSGRGRGSGGSGNGERGASNKANSARMGGAKRGKAGGKAGAGAGNRDKRPAGGKGRQGAAGKGRRHG